MSTSLLRRSDLEAAKTALTNAGFIYRHVKGIDMFLDGPEGESPRRRTGHRSRAKTFEQSTPVPAPEVIESEATPLYRVVALEPLVKMKLTSFRTKDHMHILDMIDVGLVDESWLLRLPVELSSRLKEILDNPEG